MAHHVVELGQDGAPVGRDGVHEGEQVAHADVVDRGSVQLGREGHAGQRGVAAVAGAVDAHAGAIGNALRHQPLHAIGDVVLHRQAPLAEAGFPELAAIAGGAAEVHLQHAVAAVGQKLHFGVVAPDVACPRAAVRVDDAGQVFGLAAHWQREVAVDRQAVAALVAHGFHRRHVGRGDLGVDLGQHAQGVGPGVVDEARAGRAVIAGGDDELVLGLCGALQVDLHARHLGRNALVKALGVGVVELAFDLGGDVVDIGDLLAQARPGDAAKVDIRVHEDGLFSVWFARVDDDQRLLVAAAVADGVELPVVGREGGDIDLGLVVGGDDGLELAALVGAVEHDAVQALGAHGHAHPAGVVGGPADDVARVLRHQRLAAVAQVDAVDVKDFGIAPVVADQDVMRVVGQLVQDLGPHLVARCQVGDLARLHVDGDHVVVFVAAKVLGEQDALAALPVVDADVARGLCRQPARFAHRRAAVQGLHEDVQAPRRAVHRHRLHEAQRAAIFAEAEVGLLGVGEEVAHRVGLGDAGGLRGHRQHERDRQRRADEADRERERGQTGEGLHGRHRRSEYRCAVSTIPGPTAAALRRAGVRVG